MAVSHAGAPPRRFPLTGGLDHRLDLAAGQPVQRHDDRMYDVRPQCFAAVDSFRNALVAGLGVSIDYSQLSQRAGAKHLPNYAALDVDDDLGVGIARFSS